MKIKRLVLVLMAGFLAGIAWFVYGLVPTARGFFSTIQVEVPLSAVTSYQSSVSLTGDENLVALKLTPAQLAALMAQFQTKDKFIIGAYNFTANSPHAGRSDWVAHFFQRIPRAAQSGRFRVVHDRGEADEWRTLCDFAVDKRTGRVWIYGWNAYN